jgi:hypothetical protein
MRMECRAQASAPDTWLLPWTDARAGLAVLVFGRALLLLLAIERESVGLLLPLRSVPPAELRRCQ